MARVIGEISDEVNPQVGTTYTVLISDNGRVVTLNNGSAITVTVPSGLGAGFNCAFIQIGAGQVTLVGSGATLNSSNGLKTRVQYSVASIVAYATNIFSVSGDLTT